MTPKRILVIGATGKTGRQVVAQLQARDVPVRSGSRSSEPRFDWTDQATWEPALRDVHGVYIVPLDGTMTIPDFAKCAAESGVEKLVLLSARGVDIPGYYGEGDIDSQLQGERAVRTAGPEWTILRPGWFAQNFSEGMFLDPVLAGELRLPAGAGAASFVDTEDIAAVAVAALTEDAHAGQIYELSGRRAVSFGAAVTEITEATGRRIRYVPVPVDEFVAELTAKGVSAAEAGQWVAALSPIERGLEARISDGVRRALGREPRDFTDFVRTAAAAGAWRGNGGMRT